MLLTEGQRCHEKFFIIKGCVHLFYLKTNGVEQTTDFALENWWTSDFMAFQTGSAAQFSIRAVEPAKVLCITATSQRKLLDEIPEMNEYFHLVFQKAYAACQIRFRLIYEFSKEELYRHFNIHFPEFMFQMRMVLSTEPLMITLLCARNELISDECPFSIFKT